MAETLLAAETPEATVETAHTLHAFGEVERARHLAWTLIEDGKLGEVATMPAEEPLFRDLDWLFWTQGWIKVGAASAQPEQWTLVSEARGRAAGMIFLNWAAPFIAAKTPLPPRLARAASALDGKPGAMLAAGAEDMAYAERFVSGLARRDPAMRPLAAVCQTACPEARGACMLEGLRILGGYGALMPLDTPYERLISQTEYTTSPRAAGIVRRLLAAAAPKAEGETLAQCLTAAVAG